MRGISLPGDWADGPKAKLTEYRPAAES